MNIKLNARLSAYSKIDAVKGIECEHEAVTFDDIDSLFGETNESLPQESTDKRAVTFDDIDSLFK